MSYSATSPGSESSNSRGTKRAISPPNWGVRPKKIRSSKEEDPLASSKVLSSIFKTFQDSYRPERPARLPELDFESPPATYPPTYNDLYQSYFPFSLSLHTSPLTNEEHKKSGHPTLSTDLRLGAYYPPFSAISNGTPSLSSDHARSAQWETGHRMASGISNSTPGQLSSRAVKHEDALRFTISGHHNTPGNRRALSSSGMKSEWASPAADVQQQYTLPPVPVLDSPNRYPPNAARSTLVDDPLRQRDELPKETTDFLDAWLHRHPDYPHASEEETNQNGYATGLSIAQLTATNLGGGNDSALDYRQLMGLVYPDAARASMQQQNQSTRLYAYPSLLSPSSDRWGNGVSSSNDTSPEPDNVYNSSPPPSISFVSTAGAGKKDEADSSGEETAGESEDAPWFAVPEEGIAGPPGAASDAYDTVTADFALQRQGERGVMSDHLHDISAVIQRLGKLFHLEKASYDKFLACRGASAQQLLDLLQDLLDYDVDAATMNRRRLFKALIRLSVESKLYPRCLTLTGLQQERLVAGGSFGDVYKGWLCDQSVAIKMMRVFEESDIDALLKEFGREALIWRQLSHPNLLPFFGLYYFQQRLCLVSPWMENGHMRAFLKKRLYDTDYLLSLILDVALGLEHLHDTGVVHSDLKGDNIFVTPSGRACIADFGLSSIITSVSSIQFTHSSKPTQGGTTRYQAPELLRGGHNDTLSDIYAFAGVAYEILTGTPPFPDLRTDGAVVTAVLGGCRPLQPDSCSGTPSLDSLWKLLQDCWEEKPAMRPTAAQIVQRLMSPDIQATKMQSAPDWDESFTSRFRRYLASRRPLPSFSKFECIIFGDASNVNC
ncbi:kinase-like domain-containing protein [Mycena metata]|uniref:Kinase-like domain-containing protein n=1 Tax=Mycena metata TaxID=1033252 RepID=A0AAD7IDG6_9AGAR|nr:kinase-like domain-containing protein [Mycena metata]